ncbi:MAG: hypothetical protein QF781_01530 [Phycisphaerales bacterium]|jgi:hypothetical protein|nr:hypothetical protein [Phycisphaerales bacterium]MDP7190060.1 hypothetical protein [Phycisphaerales bacterium]MDP7519677.1 hypothetical protein [Phycisphaerales bacterium]HCA38148.1 hypothetical protein [Phycisphaerales bacterium]
MIMHQTNHPHQTHPRTVAANPGLECSSGQTELLEWLQTARDWTPDTAPTWMERLRNEGVQLPPPENADESAIADLTLRLILSLAERSVYLTHTDHLSDRALYTYLVDTALALPAPPRQPGSIELIDLCPPYGHGIELMLACYASDDMRQQLSRKGISIPPRRPLSVDRDRTLPRPTGEPLQFD